LAGSLGAGILATGTAALGLSALGLSALGLSALGLSALGLSALGLSALGLSAIGVEVPSPVDAAESCWLQPEYNKNVNTAKTAVPNGLRNGVRIAAPSKRIDSERRAFFLYFVFWRDKSDDSPQVAADEQC